MKEQSKPSLSVCVISCTIFIVTLIQYAFKMPSKNNYNLHDITKLWEVILSWGVFIISLLWSISVRKIRGKRVVNFALLFKSLFFVILYSLAIGSIVYFIRNSVT